MTTSDSILYFVLRTEENKKTNTESLIQPPFNPFICGVNYYIMK